MPSYTRSQLEKLAMEAVERSLQQERKDLCLKRKPGGCLEAIAHGSRMRSSAVAKKAERYIKNKGMPLVVTKGSVPGTIVFTVDKPDTPDLNPKNHGPQQPIRIDGLQKPMQIVAALKFVQF